MTVIKPSQLKAYAGAMLDKVIHMPQCVERGGALLAIKKARLMYAALHQFNADPRLEIWGAFTGIRRDSELTMF